MNYKETLYFVACCLTISLEDKNKQAIEKQLKANTVDWDAVVKLSTGHYVFPALYCILKREGFLHYLPQDLVAYMEEFTSLNRERNEQIMIQAKELNTLLLANSITPIFLKGTGNLLAGLYEDIAERMVGDIDFIFSKEDYPKAIIVLRNNGYFDLGKNGDLLSSHRHYRRLLKENNIAAIEIHKELLREKYSNEFNYDIIKKDSQLIQGISVLSYANKLNLSILSSQINDQRIYFKTINLRNAYDIFLLSKKTKAKDAVNSLYKLSHPLNCYLAACYEVFNNTNSLVYQKTTTTTTYLSVFKSQLMNTNKIKRRHNRIKKRLIIKSRLNILYQSVLYKEYRLWLFKKLTDKNWYKEKLIQLGLK
jgi:hypothetical protein